MSDILDRVANGGNHFRPQTVSEFLALQLARKLGDTPQIRHYLTIVGQYSEPMICEAFANARGGPNESLSASFEIALLHITQKGGS